MSEELDKFAALVPLQARTGAERVATELMDLLRSGALKAGDRLPTEAELAQAFAVSRPIVREAMRSLAILGILETRQGGRCYVTDLNVSRLMAPLRFVMSLDGSNAGALHTARVLIETGLARAAAGRVTTASAARLQAMARACRDLTGDPVAFRLLDQQFHRLIHDLAENPFLQVVAQSLHELGMEYRRRATEMPEVIARSATEHEAIAAALAAGDAERAAAAMAAHLASIDASTRRVMQSDTAVELAMSPEPARLLAGKVVAITGASRGIGRGIALACARAGADVVVNYHPDVDGGPAAGEGVIAELRALGGRAVAALGDVADPQTASVVVRAAVDGFGKLDVLVANAGICPFHGFLDMPLAVMRHTTEVNLFGTFYVAQAAARQMVRQGHGGAIIGISSISAMVGGEMQAHYTPTKAGIHSLMQSCAISLGRHGIRCNSIMPGAIATDINKDDLADPEKRAYFDRRVPLGRLGEPDDIGGPVVFLASDMARYVNGAALLVDGGLFVNLQ